MGGRILLNLPDAQLDALKILCARKNKPRTVIIRDAIRDYIARHAAPTAHQDVFGLWREKQTDGLDYQERLRSEW